MSALYAMRYLGQSGIGMGAVYIGRGSIVGVDVSNGRYHGTYTEENGRVKGNVTLSSPPGGSVLVTGDPLPAGQSIPLTIDWPSDFANGDARELSLMGHPVQVTIEKIGDVS